MDETNLRNEELRISRIIEMYKKGKTLKEISLIYNASYPEIISLVKGVDMDANKPSCSRRPGRHFTAENQIKAIEMYQNKVSFPEISLSFGVHPKSVRDLIKEYNKQIKGSSETDQIPRKRCYHMPEETKQKIVNLYKGGRKIENLALEYGVTDKNILDMLNRYKIQHNDYVLSLNLEKQKHIKTNRRKRRKLIEEENITEGKDIIDHNVDPLPSQEINICPQDFKINAENENLWKVIEMPKRGYSMGEIALEVGSAPDDIHRMPLSLKTIHKDDDLLPNNQKCLKGKPKTEDEEIKISTIIEMYKEGKSLKDISAEVQESFQNILSYIKEFDVNLLKPEHIEYMKICPRILVEELPYENQKTVLEMYRNNVPIIEISETFGISKGLIHRYIREYKAQQEGLRGKEIIAPKYHYFSDESKRKIVEMHNKGRRAIEIANEYGVTASAINNQIYFFKKKHPDEFLSMKEKEPLKRRLSAEDQAKAIEMYLNNVPPTEISQSFGISEEILQKYIEEYNKPRRTRFSDETKQKIVEMYQSGRSLDDIANEFNASPSVIKNVFQYFRKKYKNEYLLVKEKKSLKREKEDQLEEVPPKKRKSNNEDEKTKISQIIEMYKEGKSLQDISAEFQESYLKILSYIKEHDESLLKAEHLVLMAIVPRSRSYKDNAENKRKVIEMYKNNVPVTEISLACGLNVSTVYKYIHDVRVNNELPESDRICSRLKVVPDHTKQEIIKMYKNKVPLNDICRSTGVNSGTIHKYIQNEKLHDEISLRRKLHPEKTKQEIIEMYEGGSNFDEIALEFGLPRTSVYGIIYKYNIRNKKNDLLTKYKTINEEKDEDEMEDEVKDKSKVSEETKQMIIEMYKSGRKVNDIAQEYGFLRKIVYKIIYDYNRNCKKRKFSTKKENPAT